MNELRKISLNYIDHRIHYRFHQAHWAHHEDVLPKLIGQSSTTANTIFSTTQRTSTRFCDNSVKLGLKKNFKISWDWKKAGHSPAHNAIPVFDHAVLIAQRKWI